MTQRVRIVQCVAAIIVATTVLGVTFSKSVAALVYHQNFDDGNGTPEVTPGGGDIATNSTASIAATGGIVGGVLNTNVASPTDATALGATTVSSGSAISGLGSLSKFTMSFWVNVDSYRTSSASRDHRTLIIGDSASLGEIAVGATGANSVVFTVRNNASGKLNPKAIDVVLNGSVAAGLDGVGNPKGIVGTTTTAGTWQFVALTYDGTSSNANHSADQLAATSGASQINGQLYFGSAALAVTRFDVPFNNDFSANASHGDATKPSAGAVNFAAAAKLLLANNATANRGLDGFIDDVRIYDSIFTAAEIEDIRLQGIGVPEPASLCLVGLGVVGVMLSIKRKTTI